MTVTSYEDDLSLEFARKLSAASHNLAFSSVTLVINRN